MPKSSPSKSVENLSYEQAFAELESIVAALENEQRSLDEAMALYERGQALIKRCAKILEKAELKVKQLAGDALTDFEEAE
ncbi:MAG TPA: exodeoxyribonuclease VII small subunit [Anaerolineales bacterium]|nr:exodeoxyribonuclease VII small subunit [Anaerolineales bacterium]